MRFRLSLLPVILILSGCFGSSKPAEAPPVATAPIAPPAKVQAKPASARDPELLRLVKLATQADQIQREAWWVVSNERKGALRSAFGKLQRAALSGLDERLASKGIFSCDRYAFQKTASPSGWSGVFSENCDPRNGPKEIATWTVLSPRKGRAEFSPANLGEVLGMGASIFGRRLSCEITWDDQDIIDEMSCPNWEQDRDAQIIRLETYQYHRNKGNILKLKGKVLENLTAIRKIETEVPLEGKIIVVETELNPPAAQPAKPLPAVEEMNKKTGIGTAKPNPLKPPPGAPLDPDLPKAPGETATAIPMRRQGKVPGGTVRTLTPEEQEAEMQRQMEQQMPVQVAPGVIMVPQGPNEGMPVMTPTGVFVPVPAPYEQPMEEEQPQPIMIPPPTPPIAPPSGSAPPAINANPPNVPVAPLAEPNYIPADQQGR